MINPKWTATKKEVTINAEGNEIPEKITYEKVQKNWLDLVIKIIGAFAIFIPLLLIYLQKNNEIELETARNRSDLYTAILTDLQIITDNYDYSKKFESAIENIQFKYTTKVHLIKDDRLNAVYIDIVHSAQLQDFLLSYVNLCRQLFKDRTDNIDNAIEIRRYISRHNDKKTDKAIVETKKRKDVLIKEINELISGVRKLQDYGWDDRKRSGIKFYRDTLMEISNRSIVEMSYLKDCLELNDEKSINKYIEIRYPVKPLPDIGDLIYPISLQARNNANKIDDFKKKFEERLLELL